MHRTVILQVWSTNSASVSVQTTFQRFDNERRHNPEPKGRRRSDEAASPAGRRQHGRVENIAHREKALGMTSSLRRRNTFERRCADVSQSSGRWRSSSLSADEEPKVRRWRVISDWHHQMQIKKESGKIHQSHIRNPTAQIKTAALNESQTSFNQTTTQIGSELQKTLWCGGRGGLLTILKSLRLCIKNGLLTTFYW